MTEITTQQLLDAVKTVVVTSNLWKDVNDLRETYRDEFAEVRQGVDPLHYFLIIWRDRTRTGAPVSVFLFLDRDGEFDGRFETLELARDAIARYDRRESA